MSAREEYLAGERLEDVLVYLDEQSVSNPEALEQYAETVDAGLVLVLPGGQARDVLGDAMGLDPMAFAQEAADRDGTVAADLTDAECPDADDGESHRLRFVFSFAEGRNPAAEGLYAEGDVIHAYASCTCGATYSDKWLVGER